MNITNNTISGEVVNTVKASFFLLDFLICSTFTVPITQTIRKDSILKKEVRYILLYHHLVCQTLFSLIGTVFYFIRAFQVNAPVLVCWIIFALQITVGRGLLLTLLLMSWNTCVAVCWPLKYLAFVHSVKRKLMTCLWIISLLDPVVSLLYELIDKGPKSAIRLDPTCPTTLSNTFSRIAGMVFVIVLVSLVLVSYIIMYREGRRAGHFTNSNHQARRTILIHGLQISLHIIPTIVGIWLGGKNEKPILELVNFIIFSFAQSISPAVYGLRCTELRNKCTERYMCCAKRVPISYGTENSDNVYPIS
ncbi:uncharacterized protein PAF06_007462 [Gastrophryne carolinensis]